MKTAIKTQSISAASILAAGFIALSGAATVVPAQAAEPAQSHTKIVRYGDLNLDTEQGAKVLYTRIRGAAGNVCSWLDGRNLSEKTLRQACFDKAVASAVEQVNKARVTALHNQIVSHTTKG
jgi:UrcA family protein